MAGKFISKGSIYRPDGVQNDANANLLYIKINPTIEVVKTGLVRNKTESEINTSVISNIAVYDVVNDNIKYLFDKGENINIQDFVFEKGYNSDSKMMLFNTDNSNLCNNNDIEERPCSDHLFLYVDNKSNGTYDFWKASKTKGTKELVKSFKTDTIYRLDPRHQKIIFINKLPNEVNIESFDW